MRDSLIFLFLPATTECVGGEYLCSVGRSVEKENVLSVNCCKDQISAFVLTQNKKINHDRGSIGFVTN